MENFFVTFPGNPSQEQWDAINETMKAANKEICSYIEDLSDELKCSLECATDVYYLRTRSRWTPELEEKLILLHRQENPPNIMEFFE